MAIVGSFRDQGTEPTVSNCLVFKATAGIQRTKFVFLKIMLTRIIPLVLLGLAQEVLGFSAPASLRSISGHSSTQGLASRPALRVPVL